MKEFEFFISNISFLYIHYFCSFVCLFFIPTFFHCNFLDRSETALFLVEEGVRVGNCDSSGLSTLTLMIDKMPPVAYTALDQFHRTDRANRKQYFYLNLLEPVKPGKFSDFTRSPMQVQFHFLF